MIAVQINVIQLTFKVHEYYIAITALGLRFDKIDSYRVNSFIMLQKSV